MTMMDTAHGPMWILWIVFAVFAVLSIVMLSGHGANLIAGYNTAGKEEKRLQVTPVPNTRCLARASDINQPVYEP